MKRDGCADRLGATAVIEFMSAYEYIPIMFTLHQVRPQLVITTTGLFNNIHLLSSLTRCDDRDE